MHWGRSYEPHNLNMEPLDPAVSGKQRFSQSDRQAAWQSTVGGRGRPSQCSRFRGLRNEWNIAYSTQRERLLLCCYVAILADSCRCLYIETTRHNSHIPQIDRGAETLLISFGKYSLRSTLLTQHDCGATVWALTQLSRCGLSSQRLRCIHVVPQARLPRARAAESTAPNPPISNRTGPRAAQRPARTGSASPTAGARLERRLVEGAPPCTLPKAICERAGLSASRRLRSV